MASNRNRLTMNHVSEKKQTGSLLNRFAGWFRSNNPEDELINYFVDKVEPKLKNVRGYRKRLQEPLANCRNHCRRMIAEIPGPFALSRSKYSDDPVMNATFTNFEKVEDLLRNADREAAKMKLQGSERLALLTMTSCEKTIFGRRVQGDMMVGDVAMRSITFDNHNMVGLTATLGETKTALEKLSLEIITEAAARQLSEIRTKLVDLRERREHLRAMNKMFGGSDGLSSLAVPFDPDKSEKQRKLEDMLQQTESEIAAASTESETPESWLQILENFLQKPEDILSMQLVSLRLDWKNVLTDDPHEKAHTITMATFTLADEMQREAILVSFSNNR